MSFALSQPVAPAKVFLTRKSKSSSRWDPHFHSPRFASLEKRLNDLGAVMLKKVSTSIFSGITPLSGGDAYTDDPDGIAFIRSGDFNEDGSINEYALIRLKPEVHEKFMRRSQLTKHDVLFAIVGATIGKVGIFPGGYEANINQAVCAVRLAKSVTPQFAHAFFLTALGKEQIERVKRPVARANINLEEVGTLRLPLLDDSKQQEVVAALNEAFAKKTAIETNALNLLKGVDDVLLDEHDIHLPKVPENSVRNRIFMMQFGELSGKRLDPYRYHIYQRQLREVVKSEAKRFKKLRNCLLHIVSGEWGEDDVAGFDKTRLERCLVIRNTEFDNDFNLKFENGREKLRLISRTKLRTLDIRPYDLLVEKSGGSIDQPVGRVAILEPGHFGETTLCFSNFIMKLRVNTNIVDPEFLFWWLKTVHRVGITQSMQAQTSGLRNLIVDEYLDQEVPVPEIMEQVAIRNRIVAIHNEAKQLLQAADNELVEAKRGIEALILGKEAGA